MHRCSPDHTQVHECKGDRTVGDPKSSPSGPYAQMHIPLKHNVTIDLIAVTFPPPTPANFDGLQTYKLDLQGCAVTSTVPFHCQPIMGKGGLQATIKNGQFMNPMVPNTGVMFLPGGDPNHPPGGIGKILKIQWCPTEDYFIVVFNGQLLDPLLPQTSVFATVSA